MSKTIGIFCGSTTGNTETAGKEIGATGLGYSPKEWFNLSRWLKMFKLELLRNKNKKFVLLFLLFFSFILLSAEKTEDKKKRKDAIINGIIVEITDKNNPVPNVKVAVKGSTMYTFSNKAGKFILKNIKRKNISLILSKIGYKTISRKILLDMDTNITIKMLPRPINIGQMEEIIVTATGTDSTNYYTPFSTSILLESEILSRNIESAKDVIKEIPGVSLVGNGFHESPSIRGLARKRVVITVDGIRLASHKNVGADVSFVNPYNIAHLEIIKGPFSTMYGSDAMGGVINITTKKSSFYGEKGMISGNIIAGYNSINKGYNSLAHIDGGINNFNFSLSAGKRKAENYNTGDDKEITGTFYDNSFVNFNGELLLNKNHKIKVLMLNSYGNDIGKPTGNKKKTAIHPKDNHYILGLNYRWANIGSLLQSIDVSLSSSKYNQDGYFTNQAMNKKKKKIFVENEKFTGGHDYSILIKGTSTLGADLLLNFGFDGFFQEDQFLLGEKSIWNVNKTKLISSKKVDEVPDAYIRDYGFFLQGLFQTTKRLSLNFGLRKDFIKSEVIRSEKKVHSDHTPVSGNFGFLYELNSFFKIGANVGTAFRVPSVKEKYYVGLTPQGMNYGNPDLKPERSTNLDLNFKLRIKKENRFKLYGNIGIFSNSINNLIVLKWDKPTGNRTGYFTNIGDARIYGVELDLTLRLKHGWIFAGSASYIKGTDVDTNEILMDIPPVQINFDFKKFFNNGKTWVGFHIRHSVKEDMVVKSDIPTEAFTLVDLSAGMNLFKTVTVRLSANNIFDTYYREYFNLVNIYGKGRGIQLSIEKKFNSH